MKPIMSKPKFITRKIDNLKDMLEQSAALYSEKNAFIKKNKDIQIGISYKKFKEDVFGLGTELLSMNVTGENIAIVSENRYEWCVSFMSVVCSGGVAVPIACDIEESKFVSMLNLVNARFVIFSEKYRDLVKNVRKKCPNLEHAIDMDSIVDDKESLSFLKMIESGTKSIESGNTSIIKLEIANESSAIIFFGKTIVKERGVMLSHKNIASEIMNLLSFLPIGVEERTIVLDSLCNSFQCICNFCCMIMQGGTINFSSTDKPVMDLIKESDSTIVFMNDELINVIYDGIWDSLGDMPNVRKTRLLMLIASILLKFNVDIRKKLFLNILKIFGKKLNTVLVTSDKINSRVLKDLNVLGFDLIICSELLEASSVFMVVDKIDLIKNDTLGFPLPGLKACTNTNSSKAFGEITLKGETIMAGYFNDKKATAKVIKDGILFSNEPALRCKNGCFIKKVNRE